MLSSVSEPRSQRSMMNSVTSNVVLKSVNLNSGVKSSNSKRLISEFNSDSFNNLQFSQSSDRSRTRAYSFEQRPTAIRQQNSQSQVSTAQRQRTVEPIEGKFVSIHNIPMASPLLPPEEAWQSKVSEFHYEPFGNNNKPTSRDHLHKSVKPLELQINGLQQKISVLIEENSKLIQINEQLMFEIESQKGKHKEIESSQVMMQSYQRETQSLNQTLVQYKIINQQQSKQILELQNLLNERNELNAEQLIDNTSRANQQTLEFESKLRLKTEQFTQLSTRYLLKCFELERINQKPTIDINEWSDKVNVLLNENENLNRMLQDRLNEIQIYQSECKQRDQLLHDFEMQVTQQNNALKTTQSEYNRQIILYQQTITSLENEIQALQQQITEHNHKLTRKNNDQITLIGEVNRKVQEKQEEIQQLTQLLSDNDEKWRLKCQQFEREMKQSYNDKLNKEMKQRMKQQNEEYNKALQSQQSAVSVWQTQVKLLQQQNEQLNTNNSHQMTLIVEKCRQLEIEWNNERQSYLHIIDQLKLKVNEYTLQQQYRQSNQVDSQFSSLGIDAKKQMINENRNLNEKVWKKCQDLMNQRYN